MTAQGYNFGWVPQAGKKSPFSKIFVPDDATAVTLGTQIQAIRVTGTDFNLSSNILATLAQGAPTPNAGKWLRIMLVCVDAAARIIRIIIENADPAKDINMPALEAAVIANCTFPDGTAIAAVVKTSTWMEVYV